MNPIMINLGFIQIYWYSFFIFSALLVGGFLLFKESKKFGISDDFLSNLIFLTVPISLVGARLYYVIFNISYYKNNFLSIFKVWEGGLAIHGGVIAGLFFIFYYCKKHKEKFCLLIDLIVPSLIIGQSIGRWGNFFNSEAHGGVTTLENLEKMNIPSFIIDGMYIDKAYYIPTFFYESIWCLFGFFILIFIRKSKNLKLNHISSFYLIWYGIGRCIIEGMRTDSLMFGSLRIAQIVSILMIFIGLILFWYSSKNNQNYHKLKEKK